jgi:hypothetical protein
MKDVSDKARKAIEEAVAFYPDGWTAGVAAYWIIDPVKGEEGYSNKSNGACHYGVCYHSRGKIVVNGHKNFDPELTLWTARESPFCHGVLNADNTNELLNHAMVIDVRIVGQGGALWLCKVGRSNTENTWQLPTWHKLRNEGLNGLQAFIGASILNKEGSPQYGATHGGLFGYASPVKLRGWYDELTTIKMIDGPNASRDFYSADRLTWGSLKGARVKRPDGWGGFTEITVPCDTKEYAAKLKEIFEGDPKNVK